MRKSISNMVSGPVCCEDDSAYATTDRTIPALPDDSRRRCRASDSEPSVAHFPAGRQFSGFSAHPELHGYWLDRRWLPLRMSCADCDKLEPSEAARKALKRARNGAPDPQTIKARRTVCFSCPNATIAHADLLGWANFSKCRLCDCNIAGKTKFGAASCPDIPQRWMPVQED